MRCPGARLCFLVVLIASAFALYPLRDHVQAVRAKGWRPIPLSPTALSQNITFLIALPHQNVDLIEPLLLSVSDPRSATYGQHLTKEQSEALFAPLQNDIEVVTTFFESNSCTVTSRAAGAYLETRCPFAVVEAVFEVTLGAFEHETIDVQNDPFHHMDRIIRTHDALTLPTNIASRIEFIHDINDFPYLIRKKKAPAAQKEALTLSVIPGSTNMLVSASVDNQRFSQVVLTANGQQVTLNVDATSGSSHTTVSHNFYSLPNYQNVTVTATATGNSTTTTVQYGSTIFPSDWITSQVAHRLYSIPYGTSGTNPANSQAVAEFDRQYYSPSDLNTFTDLMGLPNANVTVIGPNNESRPGGESTLDIEWISAVGVGVPTEFWSMENGFLASWVMSLLDAESPPLVNSISYGIPESMLPVELMTRLNNQFGILGSRGVTIISTSGDLGSSDGTDDCVIDEPDYPSSSPATTSLGASYLYSSTATPFCQSGSEIFGLPVQCDATAELPCAADAGTGFTTGGGFSATFPRPSWQDEAVQAYLNTAELPPNSYFNTTGRGFNDVGALGYNIVVVIRDALSISGGTSASGPIFAGVVGLLNDARLNAGKAPLGFMNPFLYEAANTPGAFNQVLSGNNRCREVGANGVLEPCCQYGFEAQAGWNPLTGLGTPNFQLLRDIALALP